MSIENHAIVDSTLREGEQFAHAYFTREQKLEIARRLDAFGVAYLELTSPAASPGSRADCERIAALDLRAKVLAHTRCHLDDARLAVESGVGGVNLVFGTSPELRSHSHGRSIDEILDTVGEVVRYLQGTGVEVRFSCEDTFRSDLVDLLLVYRAVAALGVDRVGVADTVGVASPRQVYDLVATVRRVVACGLEFHGHDDTGCAVANAFCALEAGATHVDTSVLGIGERNGITSLGGFVARLYARDPEDVRRRYDLPLLHSLELYVAGLAGVEVPWNNAVTGATAFTHKAGIHAKAMLASPRTYEVLDPADFGLERSLTIAHRLTGWNAVRARAVELRLALSEASIKEVTARVKALADERRLELADVDALLCAWTPADGVDG